MRVRALAARHVDLAQRLAELEDKTEALAMSHDTFSRSTRAQLTQVFDALRELDDTARSAQAADRVVTPQDQAKKTEGAKREG